MTHNKMKRTLIASVLSLLLCVSTFVGSTFAWFTDAAETGVNTIVAGTLDIDLVDADGKSLAGESLGFVNAAETTYWEPGCEYQLETVQLKNNGNLNAKYKVTISAVTGDVDLSEVIDVYEDGVKIGVLKNFLNKTIKEGVIAPNTTIAFGELTFAMQTSAGNEYQGKSIENIAITVYAAQADVEGAPYPIVASTQEEIHEAIANAQNGSVDIILTAGNYTFTDRAITNVNVTFSGTKETVFDMTSQQGVNGVPEMEGTTLTFNGVTVKWSGQDGGYQGIKNPEKVVYKNCDIYGLQYLYGDTDFVNCTLTHRNGWSAVAYNASNVTFTNCTFNTGNHAFLLYTDSHSAGLVFNATLNDCTFNNDGTQEEPWGEEQLVECADNPAKNIVYNVTINDCTVNNTGSVIKNLWGNKNTMPTDRLTITVDGVPQDVLNHPTAE